MKKGGFKDGIYAYPRFREVYLGSYKEQGGQRKSRTLGLNTMVHRLRFELATF